MKEPKNIVIVSGNLHNVGDFALLMQSAHAMRALYPKATLYCRQWARPHAEVKAQLDEHDIRLLDGKRMLSSFSRSFGSLIVVGGGQMVRDNTSRLSLIALSAQMEFANLSGGSTAIIGCGVGRLSKPYNRRVWRQIVRRLAFCSVRDQSSLENIHQISGANAAVRMSADLVFHPSPLHDLFLQDGGQSRSIIIAPCKDASEGRTINVAALALAAVRAAQRLDAPSIVVAAHDARDDMDIPTCTAVGTAIRDAGYQQVTVLSSFRLTDYINAYRTAALVMTNRLHPIIFGLLAGRPLLVLDDGGQKTRDAARHFSIPLGDINDPFNDCVATIIETEIASGADPQRALNVEAAKRLAVCDMEAMKASLLGR